MPACRFDGGVNDVELVLVVVWIVATDGVWILLIQISYFDAPGREFHFNSGRRLIPSGVAIAVTGDLLTNVDDLDQDDLPISLTARTHTTKLPTPAGGVKELEVVETEFNTSSQGTRAIKPSR